MSREYSIIHTTNGGNMKINFILEYLIVFVIVFILNYFLFIFKKTKYNKNKVPVEYYYLVSLYNLDTKKINYKKFIYTSGLINTFIITTTYIIISRLLTKLIWQIVFGIIILFLLIIICYGLLGRIYKKRGCKNV